MCYYRSIITSDNNRHTVAILWDDNDPQSIITTAEITDIQPETIDATLRELGYRIVGHDDAPALNPGDRIVIRDSRYVWFNPETRDWSFLKPDNVD